VPITLHITRLGADGDGIGLLPDGTPVYIPFTLPDETLSVRLTGKRGDGFSAALEHIEKPSPARISPPCRHFSACGGCALQHWRDENYIAWKSSLLESALHRAGFSTVPQNPIHRAPPGSRMRMDLALRRDPKKIHVGLHRARTAEIIDLEECPILHPTLTALIAPLRKMLANLRALHREGAAAVNLLTSGPDLLLRTDAEPNTADRTTLTIFARAHNLPRISWARGNDTPEPICVLRPAQTNLAGVPVSPPPGAFLQATQAGESAITAAILAALPEKLTRKAKIAELYAGCGTLTFAIATRARVESWEGDAATVTALRLAAGQAGLGGRVVATQRDLTRQPLPAKELSKYATIVLDPPFAGAAAQTAEIAASRVPRVIYVSCNPAALARDARLLFQAGYRLLSATPIDQFLWSARLESVVAFALEK
jgi:23S rRNA (uracil1939-C5)-methyltransferase